MDTYLEKLSSLYLLLRPISCFTYTKTKLVQKFEVRLMPQLPPLVWYIWLHHSQRWRVGWYCFMIFFRFIPFHFHYAACQFLRNNPLYAPKRIKTNGCPKTHKCELIEIIRVYRCNTRLELKINNPKECMIGN